MFVHVVYYYISLLHCIIDGYIHIQAYTDTIILQYCCHHDIKIAFSILLSS